MKNKEPDRPSVLPETPPIPAEEVRARLDVLQLLDGRGGDYKVIRDYIAALERQLTALTRARDAAQQQVQELKDLLRKADDFVG